LISFKLSWSTKCLSDKRRATVESEPDDGADGRVEDGEGDANGDDGQVDEADVVKLLLLAAHSQKKDLCEHYLR